MPGQGLTARFHVLLPPLCLLLWAPHCSPVSVVATSRTPQCPGYVGPSNLLHLASLSGPLSTEWFTERDTGEMEEDPSGTSNEETDPCISKGDGRWMRSRVMSEPQKGQPGVIQWWWVALFSSSLDSQPGDSFFLLCTTVQMPFPITTPLHHGGCSSVAISESQNLSKLPWPIADTLSGSGHSVSLGTKVQPFPHNVDLAGPTLLPAEDPQGSLAGIRAWGRVGNVIPPSPKGSALSWANFLAPVARRGGWRWKICSWR